MASTSVGMMCSMLRLAILTSSLLASCAAWACPGPPYPSTDACLRWTRPAKYTDGNPIPADAVVSYRVYRDGELVAETSQLFYKFTNERSGQRCYYVTAVLEGKESAPSDTGCKLVRPAAPSDGSIEAPTDGSFEPPLF